MASKPPLSKRARARKAGSARRAAKVALRQAAFEALTAGWSHQQIADTRKVHVKTVRREIDRALAERPLDAPERYAHFQVARLTKALRLADAMIDRGELKAVDPLVKLVAALDRYHGLSGPALPANRAPLAIAPAAETVPLPEPAPPLALTRAAPPLDEVAAVAVEEERPSVPPSLCNCLGPLIGDIAGFQDVSSSRAAKRRGDPGAVERPTFLWIASLALAMTPSSETSPRKLRPSGNCQAGVSPECHTARLIGLGIAIFRDRDADF